MVLAHPLNHSNRALEFAYLKEQIFKDYRKNPHEKAQMSGFFEDLGEFIGNGIDGLAQGISGAITGIVDTIKQLGETIALIVRAVIGDVEWSEVMDSLGVVFQNIGTVLVWLSPERNIYNWLTQSRLTAHAFNELDKFTGGMLTTAVNISDLPWRAMRGDPISKQELIKDAMLIIQIVMIYFTGPVGLGIMVGTMVGREVCSHQTEAKDACMVAFQIVGAAAGSWASAATGLTWGTAAEVTNDAVMSTAEQNAWLAGDEAYQSFLRNQAQQIALSQTTAFLPHLAAAGEQYLVNAGFTEATRLVANACKDSDIIGDRECEIVSQIASNYVRTQVEGVEEPWEDFLAREIARVGAEELMLQWFPPESPEHQAIRRQWEIRYIDVPVDQTVVVQKQWDTKKLLMIVGGLAVAAAGLSA